MTKYPYILKTGSMKNFFEKIHSVGIPDKLTQKFIYSLGFRSTNDRAIIPVLKFLKFVDDLGVPTERYRKFRNKEKSRIILGSAIKEAYSEVFKVYPDANQKDGSSLQNFFSTHTDLGERAVKSIVETFKALCSIADFDLKDVENESEEIKETEAAESIQSKSSLHIIDLSLGNGRKAKIIVPEDIKPQEIEKLKRLLDIIK